MATIALPAARPATRRWATLASFALFLLLCASIAYWGMQLFKPPARAVAPAPQAQTAAVNTAPAATLFGGKSGGQSNAGNFQLQGLVLASTLANTSLIMSIDGKPAQAFRADREIAPGVMVKEVQPGYVVLSDNGVPRRVELPAELKATTAAEAARTDPRVAAARNTPPPRTMPNVPNVPNTPAAAAPATSPAQQTQQAQQTPPPQPQVGPGVPVPATQAPAANAGGASAGSSGAGTTSTGTAGTGATGGAAAGANTGAAATGAGTTSTGASGAAAGAQQPVYVQSPPTMGANTGQAQPAQGAGQQSQAANQSVVHGQNQQLPGTTPAR